MGESVINTTTTSTSEAIIKDVTFNKYNSFSEFTPLEKTQTISFLLWITILIFTFYRTNKSKKKYKAMQKHVDNLQKRC